MTIFKALSPALAAQNYTLSHDGKLHLLEARRGRGKSYILAEWAMAAFSAGIPVRANFDLDLYWFALELVKQKKHKTLVSAVDWLRSNYKRIDSWDDLLTCYDTLVLLDEVNRTFDSRVRGNAGAPMVAHSWLQQSRKLKNTMVFAAQGFDWLDVRLRQLFDMLWRVKRVDVPRTRVPDTFIAYGSDPWSSGLDSDAVRRCDYKFRVKFSTQRSRRYNTFEIIKSLVGEPSFSNIQDVIQSLIDARLCRYATYKPTPDTIPLVDKIARLEPAENYSHRGAFDYAFSSEYSAPLTHAGSEF